MDDAQILPALRPVDIIPIQDGNGPVQFVLRDAGGFSTAQLAVSLPGYFILAHLDNTHSLRDVCEKFERQFGGRVDAEQVVHLVETLDEALFLHSPRFQQAYDAAEAEYLAAPFRDNRGRWPSAEELRAEIAAWMPTGASRHTREVAGLIAPHLDYARGAPCYRAAYAALLAAGPADRYVILGTNHFGRADRIVATDKPFRTPLGDVPTDAEFIAELDANLSTSLCDGQFDHLREHSVELQVHALQAAQPDHPFAIVPVLCPDPTFNADGAAEQRRAALAAFGDALADQIRKAGGRTIVIASADLSHVGQRFGDTSPTTPEYLSEIASSDQGFLALLAERREGDFVSQITAIDNATRICSVGCIYALLRALPDRNCEILEYHQAVDLAAETSVTCAAAAIY